MLDDSSNTKKARLCLSVIHFGVVEIVFKTSNTYPPPPKKNPQKQDESMPFIQLNVQLMVWKGFNYLSVTFQFTGWQIFIL